MKENKIKITIDQLVYFQTFQKLMKKLFIKNFMNASIINYFIVNKTFLRDIVLNKAF